MVRKLEEQLGRDGQTFHLEIAIIIREAGMKSLSRFNRGSSLHLELPRLYKRYLDWRNQIRDLDNAITSYEGVRAFSSSVFHNPVNYFELASLYERRFVWEDRISDLDNAITNQKAGVEILQETDPRKSDQLFKLAHLHEQRFDWDGQYFSINNAIASQEAGLVLLGDLDPDKPSRLYEHMRMRMRLNEVAKERLLEDLQQLAKYIRKPKSDVDILEVMEGLITVLKDKDADKLCRDIREHSLRLGTYCEALRSQVVGGTDRSHLRALYNEIVTTKREVSAAYKNIAAKYERMYRLWRGKREKISNMLSLLDSIPSQDYAEDIQTRIQRVDESFDTIRRMLDDQKRTLKDYFDSCKVLIASTNATGDPPSKSVPPDNPISSVIPPESLSDPSYLPKAVEAGKEKLSQVRAVVGKARYTKARKTVEDKLSTTASELEELHRGSQKYESKVRDPQSSHLTRRIKWWNLWHVPSHQLPSLITSMTNRLTEIQRGFDKYKHSVLGLIFRPLGDMIDDLRPYCESFRLLSPFSHADMFKSFTSWTGSYKEGIASRHDPL
ncbi:hypothetical protein FRC14_004706 [Serendipita sp. 396]|nr:hypothetical protein FRC14_004706 [Serendipita sp. 396]KAG8781674.1 hypothetical protein FRC15_008274 [Serendipita sp. 397]KAG8797959.1 hypothetical protein FRC16_008290 [Serendipita sp. 398]KAG8825024.1 hypothetical protein FRC19_000582 [Serendipita sp. 401]KAG8866415.1 hypothetical protein FRC20_008602 [Serendipita sp. 405]KAG9052469.1 hypothetical protein FS842_009823 [Serendipita sp. 407]